MSLKIAQTLVLAAFEVLSINPFINNPILKFRGQGRARTSGNCPGRRRRGEAPAAKRAARGKTGGAKRWGVRGLGGKRPGRTEANGRWWEGGRGVETASRVPTVGKGRTEGRKGKGGGRRSTGRAKETRTRLPKTRIPILPAIPGHRGRAGTFNLERSSRPPLGQGGRGGTFKVERSCPSRGPAGGAQERSTLNVPPPPAPPGGGAERSRLNVPRAPPVPRGGGTPRSTLNAAPVSLTASLSEKPTVSYKPP